MRLAATAIAIAAVLTTLLPAQPATAQAPAEPPLSGCRHLGGWATPLHLDLERLDQLRGRRESSAADAVSRAGSARLHCAAALDEVGGPRLALVPVDVLLRRNSDYPRPTLDGLLWSGRGIGMLVHGGVTGRWGPFSAALAPTFAYQQNEFFRTLDVTRTGISRYAWYWRPTAIDWPQRFGPDPYWSTHPGESYVRVDYLGAAAGFSTERLRWGPARRNPLLMSGGAPGFPHAFLGTSSPVDIRIGELFVEAVWGHLGESDYFDGTADNDTRLLAGLVGAFEPRWLDGLTLGFIRAYQQTIPPEGFALSQYFTEPYTNLLLNKPRRSASGGDNELFSVFARWVFPESGAEVYGEYARDDQWDGLDDLLKEPEHSAALTVGLQKLVELGAGGDRSLRIAAEATTMNFSETQRSRRNEVIFYTHGSVRQGHTHLGQLLGAPIGPSSDAQSLEIDYLATHWVAGAYLERIRFANDIYWQVHADTYTYKGHDLELTGGLRGGYLFPAHGLELVGELAWSGRYNRDFIALTGTLYDTGYEHNLGLSIGASWTP